MVTLAEAEPGAPSSTADTVSEVCTTARAPISRASACGASMPKVTGSRMATAPVPPSPGMRPMTRPAATPITSMRSSPGSASDWRAASADSSIVALLIDLYLVAADEQVDDVALHLVVDAIGLGDPLREPGVGDDRVAAEHLLRLGVEGRVGAHLLGRPTQQLGGLRRRVLGHPHRLLVGVGDAEQGPVGLVRGSGRVRAV